MLISCNLHPSNASENVCVPAKTITSVSRTRVFGTEYSVSYEIKLMPSEIAVKRVTKLVSKAAGSIFIAKYIFASLKKKSLKI
jgi:hypothetical protein